MRRFPQKYEMAAAMVINGPKGTTLSFFFFRATIIPPMMLPRKLARMSVKRILCQPRNAPTIINSITSPIPIASFFRIHLPTTAVRSSMPPPTAIPSKDSNHWKLFRKNENANPAIIPGIVILSGITRCLISIKNRGTSKYKKRKVAKNLKLNPYKKKESGRIIPEINSTTGYWNEICLLQYLHLPFNSRKLKRGILSYHEILWLQNGQCEDGNIMDSFFGSLYITTLRKLPMQSPKKNRKSNTTTE